MQGAFVQALTYSPPVILGRQMLPFSCWHGLLLEAAGSSYLVGGIPTPSDAVYGAWVCSGRFADGIAADKKALEKWGRRHRRAAWGDVLLAFGDYIEAGLRGPQYWRGGKDKPVKAPYWWHLALFARSRLGMTEAEAWDAPVARLSCYRACESESRGWDKLMTDAEAEGVKVLKGEK